MYDLDIQLTDSSGNSVNRLFGVGGSLLRTSSFYIHTYTIQIRLVAFLLRGIATKN